MEEKQGETGTGESSEKCSPRAATRGAYLNYEI